MNTFRWPRIWIKTTGKLSTKLSLLATTAWNLFDHFGGWNNYRHNSIWQAAGNNYLTTKTDNSFEMINFDLNKVVFYCINCNHFYCGEVEEADHVRQVGNSHCLIHLRHLHTRATNVCQRERQASVCKDIHTSRETSSPQKQVKSSNLSMKIYINTK